MSIIGRTAVYIQHVPDLKQPKGLPLLSEKREAKIVDSFNFNGNTKVVLELEDGSMLEKLLGEITLKPAAESPKKRKEKETETETE